MCQCVGMNLLTVREQLQKGGIDSQRPSRPWRTCCLSKIPQVMVVVLGTCQDRVSGYKRNYEQIPKIRLMVMTTDTGF